MKIATLNVDWAQKHKSANHYKVIEDYINQQDFDFIILTEVVDLELQNFNFKYFSEQLPENSIYENLNYSEYLNNEKAFRIAIYSKTHCVKRFEVKDPKGSLALEFDTHLGKIILYGTIIGTWFNKQPFAENELENCIEDCERLYKINQNLFIVGDLNTSFREGEKRYSINAKTTETLKILFENLNLVNTTDEIEKNIDHIIIPKHFRNKINSSTTFIEKGKLSDHQGICLTLKY